MFPPIKVRGQIVGGEDRSLVYICSESNATEAEVLATELIRHKIGELRDPMNCSWVELLVPPGTAEIGLEDGESVAALFSTCIRLSERLEEGGEVMLGVQEQVLVIGHNLADQQISFVHFSVVSGNEGEEEEDEAVKEQLPHYQLFVFSVPPRDTVLDRCFFDAWNGEEEELKATVAPNCMSHASLRCCFTTCLFVFVSASCGRGWLACHIVESILG